MDKDDIATELARLRALARELLRGIEALESRLSPNQPTVSTSVSPPPAAARGGASMRVPSLQIPAVRRKRDDEE